jgi:para-nitrobenzyl esterase
LSRLARAPLPVLIIVAVAAPPLFFGQSPPDGVVEVSGGPVQGRPLGEGPAYVFRGIPFAQPPVGRLRWQEPMPVLPWEGLREATRSGPPAAQASFGWNKAMAEASREDCLYLDVWTPEVERYARHPVMVWFHGGGNVGGSGGFDTLYDGEALVRHGVVLVVVEYRLGIFAFLAHPELTRESEHRASGNYGLLDQVAALRWVHDNIARFGGDPDNVTIFGQSAGAIDVLALMATPLTTGLFQKAIAESGPLAAPLAQGLEAAEAAGEGVAGAGGSDLPALRAMSAADLIRLPLKDRGLRPFTVDGWVFPENPADVWREGREHAVALIVGSNAIEFAFGGTADQLRSAIAGFAGPRAPEALALYGRSGGGATSDPLYGNAADQWGSDAIRCYPILDGEVHAAQGRPVWEYEFDRAIPPKPHVEHSSELPYVFGHLRPTGNLGGDFGDPDRSLSEQIQGYWTNFAKTGNPNGPGRPDWPRFEGRRRRYASFTTEAGVEIRANQRKPFVDLFREVLASPTPAP